MKQVIHTHTHTHIYFFVMKNIIIDIYYKIGLEKQNNQQRVLLSTNCLRTVPLVECVYLVSTRMFCSLGRIQNLLQKP